MPDGVVDEGSTLVILLRMPQKPDMTTEPADLGQYPTASFSYLDEEHKVLLCIIGEQIEGMQSQLLKVGRLHDIYDESKPKEQAPIIGHARFSDLVRKLGPEGVDILKIYGAGSPAIHTDTAVKIPEWLRNAILNGDLGTLRQYVRTPVKLEINNIQVEGPNFGNIVQASPVSNSKWYDTVEILSGVVELLNVNEKDKGLIRGGIQQFIEAAKAGKEELCRQVVEELGTRWPQHLAKIKPWLAVLFNLVIKNGKL